MQGAGATQVRGLVERDDRTLASTCRGDAVDARVVRIEETAGVGKRQHMTHVAVDDPAMTHDRDPLPGGGPITAQGLTQHQLAGRGCCCERTQERTVEAAHSHSQRVVAKWNFGLLNRSRKHDIEPDNGGAAVDDRFQNPADLRRPGQRGRALEGRRLVGFFIDRNHGDGL